MLHAFAARFARGSTASAARAASTSTSVAVDDNAVASGCGNGTHSDGVIVILVPPRHSNRTNGDADWCCTLRALRSLQRVQDDWRTPVRIFHDIADAIPNRHLRELVAAAAPRPACTVPIELSRLPLGSRAIDRSWSSWKTPLRQSPRPWGCIRREERTIDLPGQ